jgi:hypothetical protein
MPGRLCDFPNWELEGQVPEDQTGGLVHETRTETIELGEGFGRLLTKDEVEVAEQALTFLIFCARRSDSVDPKAVLYLMGTALDIMYEDVLHAQSIEFHLAPTLEEGTSNGETSQEG